MTPGQALPLVGVELHRVISFHKLFCRCVYRRSKILDQEYSIRIDDKLFNYRGSSGQVCDYERDESFPVLDHKLFKKAMKLVALIPNSVPLTHIIFSRKEILDGSIPQGYQISAQIAVGGNILLSTAKMVQLDKIFLQVDSGTLLKSAQNTQNTYCTDRAGVPLLQISSKPMHLTTKETVQLLAKIEEVINPHQLLPRGSQVIRQDLNISTPDHPRVEIKGVDSLRSIPKIIDTELVRMKTSCESQVSTRFWSGEESHFMRYPQGQLRMKRETDLPCYKINKIASSRGYLLRDRLRGMIKKPRGWRYLRSLFATHGYESFDLPVLERCATTSNWKLYRDYLHNIVTPESILRNLSQAKIPVSEQEVIDHLRVNGIAAVYRKYRLNLTRALKIKIKTATN